MHGPKYECLTAAQVDEAGEFQSPVTRRSPFCAGPGRPAWFYTEGDGLPVIPPAPPAPPPACGGAGVRGALTSSRTVRSCSRADRVRRSFSDRAAVVGPQCRPGAGHRRRRPPPDRREGHQLHDQRARARGRRRPANLLPVLRGQGRSAARGLRGPARRRHCGDEGRCRRLCPIQSTVCTCTSRAASPASTSTRSTRRSSSPWSTGASTKRSPRRWRRRRGTSPTSCSPRSAPASRQPWSARTIPSGTHG